MAEIAVGIDLGTSNTCVSMMQDGKVEVLPNAFGERTSASVVHFHDDGSVEVGNSAKAKVIHAPAMTVSSAKRLIGRYYFSEEVKKAEAICAYEIVEAPNHGVRIEIRDEEFSLPEISAMVLREMKQIAERHAGEQVTKAVITVPAYFNDNQRQATKDAGRIAGLEVLRILNEPTAAALAYGFGMGLNQRVAVYDLGGGTFDISVLEIGKDIFEVLATCGDTFLGGDDFDDRIIDLLADDFVGQHGINPRNDPFAFERLKLAAENAKKALSVDEETLITIEEVLTNDAGEVLGLERTLTRSEFAPAHPGPRDADLQGLRRGPAAIGPDGPRPRRRDPGRRPDAAADHPRGGRRLLPAGAPASTSTRTRSCPWGRRSTPPRSSAKHRTRCSST